MYSLRKLVKLHGFPGFPGVSHPSPVGLEFRFEFRSSFSLSSGCTVSEQLGILEFHLIFSFPGELWATTGVPTNSNKWYPGVLEDLNIPVRDFN
ncbi:hypothetical protein Hanom_Chr02g00137581 [Helianthus anomalus]